MSKRVNFTSDTIYIEQKHKSQGCMCSECSRCEYSGGGLCARKSSLRCYKCRDYICLECSTERKCSFCYLKDRRQELFGN